MRTHPLLLSLAGLALVTLALKTFVEWKTGADLHARNEETSNEH